ncbi:hypothetical protein [Xylanimonas ulmi]|uniref:Uncharacterized protein n=1 Tax=Xylanimonas ulmi TaxID=228973 RepID=A0A4Q7M2J1_9MICO|nr:hypothetical protein [Xylanibacterium ulmi]RZS61684.1 hypothetical protein EV386_1994 [Xylanibacterium ulmi]
MSDPFAEWRVPVTVRALTGEGSMGRTYGPAVTVPAVVELTNRLVVTADKREVTVTFTVSLDRIMRAVTPGSLVDVGEGVEREVLLVTHDDPASDGRLADLAGTVLAI